MGRGNSRRLELEKGSGARGWLDGPSPARQWVLRVLRPCRTGITNTIRRFKWHRSASERLCARRFHVLERSRACGGRLRPLAAPYLRDYSRGVQLILQRRSANRLSGWLGYTLTFARQRVFPILLPGALSPVFFTSPYVPTFEDQRHSLNAVASYRLTPTINLGGKWLYGSGFPIPSGFYALVGNTFVPVGLNQVRLRDRKSVV